MKSKAYILAAFMILSLTANAGGRDFLKQLHAGIEWGYSLTPASFHHYNFLDESIGFRIDDKGWFTQPNSNAYVLGSLIYDVSSYYSISLLSGWQGVDLARRMVPILLRMNIKPSGFDHDGFFFFSDMGLDLLDWNSQGNQFQLGSGYSIILAPHYSIGLRVGARVIYDRPEIWDPIEEEYISECNINRNDALYFALNIGLILEF